MKLKLFVAFLIFSLALSVFAGGKKDEESVVPAEEKTEEKAVEEKAMPETAQKYRQSPFLDAMVKSGELKPVDERLPKNPLVVKPLERIGDYGGTANTALWGQPSDGPPLAMNAASLTLLDPDDLYTITPGLVEDWKFNSDYTALTMFFREGTKWSDGVPFTVDDVLFWYEDCLMNEEITPSPALTWAGSSVKRIDDYTIQFTFTKPTPHFFREFGLRYNNMQGADGASFYAPKHYAEQFHIKYNPKAQELAEAAGFDKWYQLLIARAQFNEHNQYNPEVPVLHPWKVVEATPEYILWERNAYFWAVDTDGNQLPYIDSMMGVFALDRGLRQAKILAGEVDVPNLSDVDLSLYPELKSNEAKLGYRVWTAPYMWINAFFLSPNQTHSDPRKQELFRNMKFRQALSYALDRDEINEVIFLGLARPQQPLPVSGELYDEELAQLCVEYNPDKANQLLDEIGLNNRNSQGFRTWPDGSELKLDMNLRQETLLWLDISEVVIPQLREVGLDISAHITSWSQAKKDLTARISDIAGMSTSNGAVMNDILGKGFGHYLAFHWGSPWRDWYRSSGKKGEEPPDWVKEVIDLQTKILVSPEEVAIPLIKQGHRILGEHLPAIGTLGNFPAVHLIRDNIRNVDQSVSWYESGWGSMLVAYPFQWFFEK